MNLMQWETLYTIHSLWQAFTLINVMCLRVLFDIIWYQKYYKESIVKNKIIFEINAVCVIFAMEYGQITFVIPNVFEFNIAN